MSYSQLKASELTALCVERGIVKSGTKAKLVQRLQEHDLDKEKGGAEVRMLRVHTACFSANNSKVASRLWARRCVPVSLLELGHDLP